MLVARRGDLWYTACICSAICVARLPTRASHIGLASIGLAPQTRIASSRLSSPGLMCSTCAILRQRLTKGRAHSLKRACMVEVAASSSR